MSAKSARRRVLKKCKMLFTAQVQARQTSSDATGNSCLCGQIGVCTVKAPAGPNAQDTKTQIDLKMADSGGVLVFSIAAPVNAWAIYCDLRGTRSCSG